MRNGKKVNVESLVKELGNFPIVKLILPKNFKANEERHPIEKYFRFYAIAYYFEGDDVENKEDYCLDLNETEIIY